MTDAAPTVLRVAVAAPLPGLFDYLPPASGPGQVLLGAPAQPGCRVLVPFGRGRRVGIVVAIASGSELAPGRLKPVQAVLDPAPLLGATDLALLVWAAGYYHSPPGEVLFSALPVRLRRPEPLLPAHLLDEQRPGWRATAAGHALAADGLQRAPRQAQALALLCAAPAGLGIAGLRANLGDCSAVLRALADKGLIERALIAADTVATLADRPLARDPASSEPVTSDLATDDRPATSSPTTGSSASGTDTSAGRAPAAPGAMAPVLNPEQQAAVATIGAALGAGFGCFLLDGVTGSGKTEVYLRLIEQVLASGGQVLVLVPEIGLTPQLATRFARRLSAPLAVLHSGLGEREREVGWQRAASGRARVLLGTRSAIFTPLPDLALVLVDEEHDQSLKQQDGFRYSARDLAVRRAQHVGCPVVLGSATPSLESLHNARLGRYRHLRLTRRAGDAKPPRLLVADIRAQPLQTGLSHALLTRMDQEVLAGNQVLLFLNRRGFSPVLTCHDCGWISVCQHCDARMTLHRERGQLRCHHCAAARPLPTQCPYCGSPDLRPLGQGTERVEDTLRARFPGIPLARIDRDSTRRQGELERQLAAARRGDTRILLGTQMLAKGHHLPGITLVGIMDLDHGLYGTDFRATERMAQLLIQVAGRAGRAERPGTVLLQTRHPSHPLLVRLLRDGYGAFAEAALAERAEARLPPFSHQALLRADSPREQAALAWLHAARDTALNLCQDAGPPLAALELWGPAPASMERRAGRIRAQLLLQAPHRGPLQALLGTLLPRLRELPQPHGLRWGIDVDPRDAL